MNQRNGFFSSIPPVTKNLVIINFLLWLVQFVLLQKGTDITNYLGLQFFIPDKFMPHQIITYMFMHDPTSIGHVFFNMFAVFMFGRTLEGVWGSKQFLFYYIVTGIGAGLTQELVWTYQYWDILANPVVRDASLVTVGASGAVFGILLAFGMLFPNSELFIIPFPFPIKAKYFVIGYGLMELFLGVKDRPDDNVAHFAHLGGLIFGLFLILYWRKTGKSSGRIY